VAIARPIAPKASAGRADGGLAAGCSAVAVAAGFSAADFAWERYQEHAALAYRAGDVAAAARAWEQALAIAEQQFARGDPRLAASLTNQALVMRRRGQVYQAQRLFEEAFAVWQDSWRWIYLMTPGRQTSRQKAQSDRLATYDDAARAWFTALAERGCAATAMLERFDQLPKDSLAEWLELKPRGLSDLRKLLAAVLLIAPKPH
jgi:tetratricopeptide (TPR) repeat protein